MWHEARRSERKVHDMMDAARKRAQRRAVFLAKRRGDPQQSIQGGISFAAYLLLIKLIANFNLCCRIPWNGKQDVLIDRFDGRALLDFIREPAKHLHAQKKSEEEEELEEFVNFERYRDLIKHRRRGCRFHPSQPSASKGTYSQVGFSYDGNGSEGQHFPDDEDEEDEDEDDDEDDYNSDDSNDEGMDIIAKEFGVKRYGWLVYMDKKAKEEEKRQKEAIKGDPAIRKLSRKERRKASQIEREREREASRVSGARVLHHDPYREPRRSPTYEAYPRFRRSRSRSRSYSPSYSRRHARGSYSEEVHRSKSRTPKVEYITEFGGSGDGDEPKLEGFSPPPSPPAQADLLNRPSSGCILEALHVDPASGVSLVKEKSTKSIKPAVSTSSALSKLTKSNVTGGPLKQQQGEKKETPQERLKRIMSKQLNKQIKKDTAAEMAKKQEQERQRQEKLAETSRLSRRRHSSSRSRSYSRSPPR
ncbi:DRY EERY domain-containing protein [Citrus sinensis]|nr:DRY EERY domain-containing protein [Citrus sinensis]